MRASPSPPLAEASLVTRSYHDYNKHRPTSRHERSYHSEPAYHLTHDVARTPYPATHEDKPDARRIAQDIPPDHSILSSHQEFMFDEASALHRRKLSALDEKYNDKVAALDLRLKVNKSDKKMACFLIWPLAT